MKRLISDRKAFGLIETLIACAVLLIVCGALLTISTIVSRDITFARNRTIAYALAQEAVESMRQIRDTNLIDSNEETAWNSFVCDFNSVEKISTPKISTNNLKDLYLISTDRSVCYPTDRVVIVPDLTSSGEDIQVGGMLYNRKIYFTSSGIDPLVANSAEVVNQNAIRITVEINWVDRGANKEINLTELLTNWKRGF
jgi:type II secretory pathway pseudopilin PulG